MPTLIATETTRPAACRLRLSPLRRYVALRNTKPVTGSERLTTVRVRHSPNIWVSTPSWT